MGEIVWTVFTVGGKATRSTLKALAEYATGTFGDCENAIAEALASKSSVTFSANLNYAEAEDIEAFCIDHDLPFVKSFSAAPGCFDSGSLYWRPGMADIAKTSANDHGDPSISISDLRRAATAGQTLADVIAGLSAADAAAVPPLELGRRSRKRVDAVVAAAA